MRLKFRPMAVIGFTMLSVMFLSIYVNTYASAVAIAAGTVLFIVSLSVKKIREQVFPIFLACALVVSGLIFTATDKYSYSYAEKYVDTKAEINAVITDNPKFENSRYYYVLKTNTINGEEVKTKLRLSLPAELDADAYDTVTLTANVYKIGSGSDDITLYYKSKGVFLGAYAYNDEDFEVIVEKCDTKPIGLKLLNLRDYIKTAILDKLPNEYGGVGIALLLGDKSFIDDDTITDFREVGITPLFAVSGLHLSIWVLGLYELLNQLKIKKRVNSIIGIAFTLFFMALTGFSSSVCRAGLMMLLMLCGNLFYRKSDSINSLGFAALVLCVINPYIAADIGFLLSFSATFGIVSLMPIFSKFVLDKIKKGVFEKALKSVLGLIFVSISASVGSLPATIFFIGYVSLWAAITNLLLNYVAGLCMIFSGLTVIFSNIRFVGDLFGLLTGLISRFVLFVVEAFSKLSVTTVSTSDIYWKTGVILCLAVLAFAVIAFKGKTVFKVICVGVSTSIIFCSVISYIHYDNLTELRVLNVENGVCAVAFYEGKKIILGCNSDYYYTANTIEDTLNQISRKDANLLIIPDEDSANSESTLQLLKSNDFNKIIMPCENMSVNMIKDKSNLLIQKNSLIEVWDNSTVSFVCSDNYSIAYCNFDGKTVLMIFSAEKYAEIPKEYEKADILITSVFIPYSLDVSNFERVILSCCNDLAKEEYNYTLSKGIKTLSTAQNGDITIDFKNGETKIIVEEG